MKEPLPDRSATDAMSDGHWLAVADSSLAVAVRGLAEIAAHDGAEWDAEGVCGHAVDVLASLGYERNGTALDQNQRSTEDRDA